MSICREWIYVDNMTLILCSLNSDSHLVFFVFLYRMFSFVVLAHGVFLSFQRERFSLCFCGFVVVVAQIEYFVLDDDRWKLRQR